MSGTEDEVRFGDKIQVDLTKEEDGRTIHHHLDCKFLPEIVELLLENGVIEEGDTEEKDGYDEYDGRLAAVEEKVEKLSDVIKKLLKQYGSKPKEK
jgi:hypothetical protein